MPSQLFLRRIMFVVNIDIVVFSAREPAGFHELPRTQLIVHFVYF